MAGERSLYSVFRTEIATEIEIDISGLSRLTCRAKSHNRISLVWSASLVGWKWDYLLINVPTVQYVLTEYIQPYGYPSESL